MPPSFVRSTTRRGAVSTSPSELEHSSAVSDAGNDELDKWNWERGGYESREELRRKERTWAWAYLWFVLAALAIGAGVAGA